MSVVLWVLQALLAVAFILAGFMKAARSVDELKKNMAWVTAVARPFVRFIGIAEILGGIGLLLPALTHIATWLTIAAAAGLVIVMLSAAIFHASRREFSNIGANIVLLLLAAFIVVGRLVIAPF